MPSFPVINSTLSARHLGLFLQVSYNLSANTSCSLLKTGINDSYLVVDAKTNFELMSKLTDIYNNQARIDKLEEKVGGVFLSWESRKPENAHATLVLMRDNYKGWAYGRAPSLIAKYDEAIKMLDKEE